MPTHLWFTIFAGKLSGIKMFANMICFQSALFPVTVKKGESSKKYHSEVLEASALLVHRGNNWTTD